MPTKWTITRLTCAVMLHNQPAMKVSMFIQGKRYKSNAVCSIVARFCGPLRMNVLLQTVFI